MKLFSTLFALALLLVFTTVTPSFADQHARKLRIFGTVTSIDTAGGSFAVKQQDGSTMTFVVDQRSEFEVETRATGHDVDVPFTDLKVGDNVKVKAFPAMAPKQPLVDDVEIYR